MSGEHLCCFANSQSQPSLGVCGWGGIRGWGEICPVVFTRTITQLCTQWNKHSSNATTDVERKNECEETKNEADENTSIRSTHSWQQKKLLWLLRQLYSTFPESLLSLHHCLFGFFLLFFSKEHWLRYVIEQLHPRRWTYRWLAHRHSSRRISLVFQAVLENSNFQAGTDQMAFTTIR